MPCNSEHMAANQIEIECSRLVLLHQEVDTGKHVNSQSRSWDGYHPSVYCKGPSRQKANELTASLCAKLKAMAHVTFATHSLELQVWWRDHQKADAIREAREAVASHQQTLRNAALAKLTPEERAALDLE